ncbi:MAG: hypothetical protein DLM62_08745 [Pseudonocardiales bacterium]|nr:MAG: hypothetical protein DLM62_08745 [Pseudonocardiales bacterium]
MLVSCGPTTTWSSQQASAHPSSPEASTLTGKASGHRPGCQESGFHDLRHTVVSLLLELGTPPHVVQAIARHADLDVTMRIYAHQPRHDARALDKIDWDAE